MLIISHNQVLTASLFQVYFKSISSLFRAYFKSISSLFRVYFESNSSLFQVYFKSISSLFQVYFKSISSLFQVYFKCISIIFNKSFSSSSSEATQVLYFHIAQVLHCVKNILHKYWYTQISTSSASNIHRSAYHQHLIYIEQHIIST